jgi:hypothetical protein
VTDDWTPEKESEDDPIKLQKEQIAMGKEFLARLKREEEERKAREMEYTKTVRGAVAPVYKPPTFEEVSAVLKKAWEGVEAIMPTAGDQVKAHAFQMLVRAAAPPPSFEI